MTPLEWLSKPWEGQFPGQFSDGEACWNHLRDQAPTRLQVFAVLRELSGDFVIGRTLMKDVQLVSRAKK